jgi:hypothetical protein
MNELARFHNRVKRRLHRPRELKSLLTSVGITVPYSYGPQDMTNRTYAVGVIQNLVDEYGKENVRLALRLLTETNEENAKHIRGSVVTALTVLVSKHEWGQIGLALFDAMDKVDVGDIVRFCKTLKHDHEPHILIGLIAGELRRHLGDLG